MTNLSVTQRIGTPLNVHALSMFIWKPEEIMSLSLKGLLTLLSRLMITPASWNPGLPTPGMITFPEIIYSRYHVLFLWRKGKWKVNKDFISAREQFLSKNLTICLTATEFQKQIWDQNYTSIFIQTYNFDFSAMKLEFLISTSQGCFKDERMNRLVALSDIPIRQSVHLYAYASTNHIMPPGFQRVPLV